MNYLYTHEQPIELVNKIINFGKFKLVNDKFIREYDIFSEIILNKNFIVYNEENLLKNYPNGIITKDNIFIPADVADKDNINDFLLNVAIQSIVIQTNKFIDNNFLENILYYYQISKVENMKNIPIIDNNELEKELKKFNIEEKSIVYLLNKKCTLSEKLFNKILEKNEEIKNKNHPFYKFKDLKSLSFENENNIIINIKNKLSKDVNNIVIDDKMIKNISKLNDNGFFYLIEEIKEIVDNNIEKNERHNIKEQISERLIKHCDFFKMKLLINGLSGMSSYSKENKKTVKFK